MKYSEGNGKYQKEYDMVWRHLMPMSGEAENEMVEALRRVAHVYYPHDWDKLPEISYLDGVRDYISLEMWDRLYNLIHAGEGLDKVIDKIMERIIEDEIVEKQNTDEQ